MPIAIAVRERGEWALIHQCRACGEVNANRIAGDDDELSLLVLALRPLSNPAFPLDVLRRTGAD